MYINYLWSFRLRPKGVERIKVYAKRLWTIFGLLKLELSMLRFLSIGGRGELSVISPRCRVNGKPSKLHLGREVSIGEAFLHLHERIDIGDYSVINHGVVMMTASHYCNDELWRQFEKPIKIGRHVWIATNAMILPGVTIGDGAVIGAGSVVSKNVEPYAIVAGNPAVKIKDRVLNEPKYSPVRFRAPFEAWLGVESE
jgi:maltose O-acetyltransferase